MKFWYNTGCGINVGSLLDTTYMLRYLPQFTAYFYQPRMHNITVIETTIIIERKPATDLSQFIRREFVKGTTHHKFDNRDACRVENTPQQTALNSKLIILIDEAQSTQGKDRPIKFSGTCPT